MKGEKIEDGSLGDTRLQIANCRSSSGAFPGTTISGLKNAKRKKEGPQPTAKLSKEYSFKRWLDMYA